MRKQEMMTKTEALTYIRDAFQCVLDDDFPDKADDVWCALCDDYGFSEAEAEELVYGDEWI